LNGFDNNNRVVNHEADGEHKSEKRKRVDRESEQREHYKRAEQRNRHRAQWNERGAPALQKNKYDDNDQRERLKQHYKDVVQSFSTREGLIQRDYEIHVRRKTLLGFG